MVYVVAGSGLFWKNNPMTTDLVSLRFEKSGRGGKMVTLVSGLRMHPEGKLSLLSTLKKKLGTGGALKEGVLELQGDQRERLPPLLFSLGVILGKGRTPPPSLGGPNGGERGS